MRIILVILVLGMSCVGSKVRVRDQEVTEIAKDWISAISGVGGGNLEYSKPHRSCSVEKNMRLTADRTAWCADNPIVKGEAYVQVNAGRLVKWEGIGIKGRNAWGGQYVKTFKVKYTVNGRDWIALDDNKEFVGNKDATTIKYNSITLPKKALAIRIYPQTWNNHCSMNIDAYYTESYL